jgi:hypothetical protein
MAASPEPPAPGTASGRSRSEPTKRNRGALPADLPRVARALLSGHLQERRVFGKA